MYVCMPGQTIEHTMQDRDSTDQDSACWSQAGGVCACPTEMNECVCVWKTNE